MESDCIHFPLNCLERAAPTCIQGTHVVAIEETLNEREGEKNELSLGVGVSSIQGTRDITYILKILHTRSCI